ncbi:MAG: putative maltokinase [Nitrospirae bacterium]|nr:putative maltokinase [Nitrospirota bacterium]
MLIEITIEFEEVFSGKTKKLLEKEVLPSYLTSCRWFASKAKKVQDVEIIEDMFITGTSAHILFIRVTYTDGLPEIYLLPVAVAPQSKALLNDYPFAVIANVTTEHSEVIIYDATYDDAFRRAILSFIIKRKSAKGLNGHLNAFYERRMRHHGDSYYNIESSQVLKADQSNSSLLYEKKLIMKLFRKLEEGINPDIELLRFIAEKNDKNPIAENIPIFMGSLEYKYNQSSEPIFIANLQSYVQNEGDAWNHTVCNITRFYEEILSSKTNAGKIKVLHKSLLDVNYENIPKILVDLIGIRFLGMVSKLGKTTGDLHLTLASHNDNPDFTPEPFSTLYQRSLYQSMHSMAKRNLELLRKNLKTLPDPVKEESENILNHEKDVLQLFKLIVEMKITASKIRIHGDYHLGQVLWRGNEFVIIDFEGEPLRSLSDRRLKRSPLRDLAGMIRSLHYAPYSTLLKTAIFTHKDILELTPWADLWYFYISGIFLSSYLDRVKTTEFIPSGRAEFENLLRVFMLEKAVYELGYELNHRPEWLIIPLKGVAHILGI